MSKRQESKKRASKQDWLEAALEMLESAGIDAVRVEKLAARLGISKSGFYWHFRDRSDLQQQLLEFWAHEYTEIISDNPQFLEGNPEQRLEKVARMIHDYQLNRFDLAMWAWAKHDPMAAAAVENTLKMRLAHLRGIFSDMGFTGYELEMRTMLFVSYFTCEPDAFVKLPIRKRKRIDKLRLALFSKA